MQWNPKLLIGSNCLDSKTKLKFIMKIYKKIGGKVLIATLENPQNRNQTCKLIFLNYKHKGEVHIIKEFLKRFQYIRESTEEEDSIFYNELL